MTGKITWTELVSQPEAWRQVLARCDLGTGLPELSLADFDEVVLLGSGTSYYLALAAADWIRRRHALSVRAVPACEVMLDSHEARSMPDGRRLAIAFSRSGESTECLLATKALRLAGATVLTVSCTTGSSLLKLGDHSFCIAEGAEHGLVMLRSFTSMLIAVQFLFGTEDDRGSLRALPAAGQAWLDGGVEDLRSLASRRAFDRFVFLGSASTYPMALEASLKIQEMSISTSEAYHSLEYRHGPKATANGRTLVTLFALPDNGHGAALARDLVALGVTLLVVGPGAERYADIADLVVPTAPGIKDDCAGPLSLLPLQVMAFETAMRLERDPDAPVNLSKVVTF